MGRRPDINHFAVGLRHTRSGSHLREGRVIHDQRDGHRFRRDNGEPHISESGDRFDQPVVVTGSAVTAIPGTPFDNVLVATFTDPEGADPLSAYIANIDWGDGQSSAGTITYDSGTQIFSVYGSYTYPSPGNDTITVTIDHGNAAPGSATVVATVASGPTTTALGSSVARVVYGHAVTFTAAVAGSGVPTGTVTFYAGMVTSADQLGTATLRLVGDVDQATFTTDLRTAAAHMRSPPCTGATAHTTAARPASSTRPSLPRTL